MEKEEGSSDMEVLLLCKEIEIQKRPFCFEFKENPQLQYMQISNTGFSILLPSHGISCFLDALESFCSGFEEIQQQKSFTKHKQLKIDDKEFFFRIGHNKWGPFLKVWEASTTKNNGYIVIPSGNNGWELFRRTLAELDRTSRLLCPLPLQRKVAPAESPIECSDAEVDSSTSPSDQNLTVEQLNIAPSQNEKSSIEQSKNIRVGSKKFYFDLGSNKKGRFLKISEVMDGYRSFIIIPLVSLQQFHEMVGHFLQNNGESSATTSMKQEFRKMNVVKEPASGKR